MSTTKDIEKECNLISNKEQAKKLQKYFKTGKGEYGYGDKFIGLRNSDSRAIAKNFATEINLKETEKLLNSKIHEQRLIALLILEIKFNKNKKNPEEPKKIFDIYMRNTDNINNWDLVDLSAPNIAGEFLKAKDRSILYEFAKSDNLWKKRIAILSCFTFIRDNDFIDALKIGRILLYDKHDLIHKAVGWALREIGKKDQALEERFLEKYYKTMPRTCLRYAIEKFDSDKRSYYMKK